MKITGLKLLLVSALFFSTSIGCGVISADGNPTSTPAKPSSSPTPIASTEELPEVVRFFTEEFNAEASNWEIVLTSGDSNLFSQRVENGYWDFQLGGEYMYAYMLYKTAKYRNVRVEVRTENRGANKNFTSLICQFDIDKGWYEFDISNDGVYHILYAAWDADEKKTDYHPLANGRSNLIRLGQVVNDYAAHCIGSRLVLFINGEEVYSLVDDEFVLQSGQVGLGVSSFDVLPVRVGFDSVTVSEPQE